MVFWKVYINRMNGGYEMIWKLSYGWNNALVISYAKVVSYACIKGKFCFEDFTKPLAFFCVSKNIKISCIKFLYSMWWKEKYIRETYHYT